MSGIKSFFDTNILLYAYNGPPDKTTRARKLFSECNETRNIVISTQVVQEFYAVGSRKLGIPKLTIQEATNALFELPIVVIRPSHMRAAIDNEATYQISFWDGLIVAAAEAGGAQILYTEDLNHGQKYGTVEARNPFR